MATTGRRSHTGPRPPPPGVPGKAPHLPALLLPTLLPRPFFLRAPGSASCQDSGLWQSPPASGSPLPSPSAGAGPCPMALTGHQKHSREHPPRVKETESQVTTGVECQSTKLPGEPQAGQVCSVPGPVLPHTVMVTIMVTVTIVVMLTMAVTGRASTVPWRLLPPSPRTVLGASGEELLREEHTQLHENEQPLA